MTIIPTYPVTSDIDLEPVGSWPASVHRFSDDAATALRAAEAAGRPLLIRGRPGVGKSQTARAAAAATNRRFLSVVIDGRTEPHDLMWRFDAVRRLSDSHTPGGPRPEVEYLTPGPLWWAFNWIDAESQAAGKVSAPSQVATDTKNPLRTDRAVLLIDEIDKADPDLPNALLEVLANLGFPRPGSARPVTCAAEQRPLIVITTNEERELPAAFLRRCLVLTLELPADRKELEAHLTQLGIRHQRFLERRQVRKPGQISDDILREAAQAVADRRDKLAPESTFVPGTAEYLDLVQALAVLWPSDEIMQRKQLKQLERFVLNKELQTVTGTGSHGYAMNRL